MRSINKETFDKIKESSPKAWAAFLAWVENWQNSCKCYIVNGFNRYPGDAYSYAQMSEDEVPFEVWPFEFQFGLLAAYMDANLSTLKDENLLADLRRDIDKELEANFAELEHK